MRKTTGAFAVMGVTLIAGFLLITVGQKNIGASIVIGIMIFTWIVGDWARSKRSKVGS